MKFDEIASRLTGLSCPIFGISWNPPESERSVARRVIAFLEDRRVLYTPYEMEVPSHCIQSVLEIRQFLTSVLQGLTGSTELSSSLRAMRAVCRKFLDGVGPGTHRGGMLEGWIFNSALGELRGVVGIHVARLAAQHGLDVEDDLAVILPVSDTEGLRPRPRPPRTPDKRRARR